jgi:hypothetical protein
MRSSRYFTPTVVVRLEVALLDLYLDNLVEKLVVSVAEDRVRNALWG